MGHKNNHKVIDSALDKYFTIDSVSRAITNDGPSKKLKIVKGDHNSEVFTFKLPRTVEGHDMSLCNSVEVHYINIDSATRKQHADVYTIRDGVEDSQNYKVETIDGEEFVTITWLLSRAATGYKGTLSFAIKFECTEPDSETGEPIVTYSWNTDIFTNIVVLDTMDNSETAIEPYYDILEQWWNKIQYADDTLYAITEEGVLLNLTEKINEMGEEVEGLAGGLTTESEERKSADDEINTRLTALEELEIQKKFDELNEESKTAHDEINDRIEELESKCSVIGIYKHVVPYTSKMHFSPEKYIFITTSDTKIELVEKERDAVSIYYALRVYGDILHAVYQDTGNNRYEPILLYSNDTATNQSTEYRDISGITYVILNSDTTQFRGTPITFVDYVSESDSMNIRLEDYEVIALNTEE